jgi:oxalate decarboxylase/phosphoglucose isomerase-like protein (cupin superfamily)
VIESGAMRELHWPATAAEWSFVIEGRTRTTVIDPQGNAETNDFGPGGVWCFPRGHAHMLECLGYKRTLFILIFDNGYFSEFGTFSITALLGPVPTADHVWVAHNPAWRNQPRMSLSLTSRSPSPMASYRCSLARAPTRRRNPLNFENISSIGVKSGL